MANFLRQLNDDASALIEQARPALVRVVSGRREMGSGIIWRADGLIVTNAHVIRRRAPRVVLSDGQSFPSQALGLDRRNDLAALRIEASDLPALPLGDSRSARPGQAVTAMGFPWGITAAVTSGVVVGSGAGLAGMPGGSRELIAVSLHLRPGYSGGPLLDDQGRALGVNVMMAGPEVGLAIPAHVVEAFLEALGEQASQAAPEANWTPVPV